MSTGITPDTGSARLFQCPVSVFDEVYESDGRVRAHWQRLLHAFRQLSHNEFLRRNEQADRMLRENGVNFHAFADTADAARPWRLDLLPLVIPSSEWAQVETGLAQRARLLNAIIRDIYGPQTLVRDGLLPPELVFGNPEFIRAFWQLQPTELNPMFLYAAELARSPNGQWLVMADRSEAPAGPGFALENRIVSSRTIPSAFKQIPVERIASFFVYLQNSLRRRAPRNSENPRTVLLTHGPTHRYYFEDVYLARYLGYTLVEGADLAVRNDCVFLKTLSGLLPVDIILCRSAESGLDPLELGANAAFGVPGLLNAARTGNVAIANTPGCGIVGAPVFMAFFPQICEHLFGEPLQMPSIPTWWCGDPNSLTQVRDRFETLVIKPAFQKSGGEEIIVSDLAKADREGLLNRIQLQPWSFVAQEKIARSGVPVWHESGIRSGHVAVRAFMVEDESHFRLMPGGLIRIAPDTGPMQLSVSAGDGSKDMWVLAEGKVDKVTLLAPGDQPAELRRTSALFPSRVADNLFWLGRTIDRCDFLSRVIRSLAERLLGDSSVEPLEVRFLARVLSEQGQLEPGFVVDGLESQLPALADAFPLAVFDSSEVGGLANSVSELTRLSSLVRDWLSPDTWQRIHHTAEAFQISPTHEWNDLADVVLTTNRLIGNLASVSGLISDGMNRGPSWRFLELGRSIERAGATARLLLTADLKGPTSSPAILKTLVEVLDVQMTYRFRYRDQLQRNAVLDLAITDETNPRSLVFQIERLVSHVDRLPGAETRPLRSEDMRLVMHCAHAVRMLTTEDLAAQVPRNVVNALRSVEEGMTSLSNTLTRKYLVHSGTPRQITDFIGGAP